MLLTNEIQNCESVETLFRANSLASKSFEMYMILSSFNYLHYCVKETVDKLYKDASKGRSCELDASKGEDMKKNWKYTQKILEKLLDKIYASVDKCPSYLREIFEHIQIEVEKKFPKERNVKCTGVSAFLFLRFICPAILGPKLFDMANDHPSPKVSANVTQIAKIIQRIANMSPTEEEDDPVLNNREKFIEFQKQCMRKFINQISKNTSNVPFFNPLSVDVQKECAYFHEHCEKNLSQIIEVCEENTCAKELIIILDKMNDTYGKKRPHGLKQNEAGEWIKNPEFKPLDNFIFDVESESSESSRRQEEEDDDALIRSESPTTSSRFIRTKDSETSPRMLSKDDSDVLRKKRRKRSLKSIPSESRIQITKKVFRKLSGSSIDSNEDGRSRSKTLEPELKKREIMHEHRKSKE